MALWRTVLARRRVLVVLDDAADERQLGPLLPADAGSAALVTAWRRILNLPGARWVKVDGLCPADSVAFLERIVGEGRLRSEPEFAARLATMCGHHPMALRLLGVRLQARPTWRMADSEQRLAASLSDCGVRHDDCAIFHARILPVVGLLGSGMRAAFRQLAVPDVPDLTVASAAALLGERPEECQRILETLVDAHLLELPAPGRYRFHPLVRQVAGSCHGSQRGDAERDNALAVFGQAASDAGLCRQS
jgi:hypothetical protein